MLCFYLADLFGTGVEVDGVVIPLGEKVPSGFYVWNLHYLADLFRTGVEVDGVVIPLGEKVPSSFYVRNLHGITDGLDMAGRGSRLWAKQGCNPRLQ
jgi:hypothetical protein